MNVEIKVRKISFNYESDDRIKIKLKCRCTENDELIKRYYPTIIICDNGKKEINLDLDSTAEYVPLKVLKELVNFAENVEKIVKEMTYDEIMKTIMK